MFLEHLPVRSLCDLDHVLQYSTVATEPTLHHNLEVRTNMHPTQHKPRPIIEILSPELRMNPKLFPEAVNSVNSVNSNTLALP